jgi:hypothetical protein
VFFIKQKLDFIIKENDFEKIIFRFYPRRSHCHSHNEHPPKTWDNVYKVYYYYSILAQRKDFEDNNKLYTEVLFDSEVDECSVIDQVAYCCKIISSGKNTIERQEENGDKTTIRFLNKEIFTLGDGVSWIISKYYSKYQFQLFNAVNKGYRFFLDKKKIKDLGEFLESCCEYMLAHGEPI